MSCFVVADYCVRIHAVRGCSRGCMYAHDDLGCKGTKKKWNMQIREEKSAKYFSFARDLACFGGFIKMKSKKRGRKIGIIRYRSIPIVTAHQSACMRASRQSDNPFRLQTLLHSICQMIPSKKSKKFQKSHSVT